MSKVLAFRCVICTLYDCKNDRLLYVQKSDAKVHIYAQHNYQQKVKAGRILELIQEDQIQGADWLTEKLVELSIC